MLFNSLAFCLFFPIVIFLYFLCPPKYRWILLLIASYYFYMCWKVEYAFLIMLSTVVDYFAARKMSDLEEKSDRRKWLYLSLFVNLGLLFTFKYLDFFGSSINSLLSVINIGEAIPAFKLLLPVGISFYTFQTLSYSVDVYNGKIKAEKHFGIFALYVSFFPQLVAGPIERPDRLIPQLKQTFQFDYARVVDGLRMMFWGFFLKLVIADNAVGIVDKVYARPEKYQGFEVIVATIFFAYQIFCDFAGYSIIAIGAAKVMGYDLMQNFNRPYFANSIREFWQRWHISLSTWFRDYCYIPLGGNRVVKWRWYYNLMVTFVVSGLWHGANWTFIVWGFLHGAYLVLAIMMEPFFKRFNAQTGLNKLSVLHKTIQVVTTFVLVCISWVFFRAQTVGDAFYMIKSMFNIKPYQFKFDMFPNFHYQFWTVVVFASLLVAIHFCQEVFGWKNPLFSKHTGVRWATYVLLGLAILSFGAFNSSSFIYFQF